MSDTLQVVAIIIAKPGQAAAVQAAFEPAVAASRNEAGCRRYDLFVDNNNPDRLIMIEEWTSKAALDLHMTMPHFKAIGAQIGALIEVDVIEMTQLA